MIAVWAIVPVFGLILLGYLLGKTQWLTVDAIGGLSKLTFKLFLPCLLFSGIVRAPLHDGLSIWLLLAYFIPALGLMALVNLWAHRRYGIATAMGLGATFSNNVLLGIPVISKIYGNDALVYVFAVLAVHSLLFFSSQSFYVAFGSGEKPSLRRLLGNLANPLIIGLLLGGLVNISGLAIPEPLWRAIDWIAHGALPCSLIVLGVGLTGYRLRLDRQVWLLCTVKLLLMPALVWCVASLMPGLPHMALLVLVLMAANPTGVNVLAYVEGDQVFRRVSSAIFLSTLLAALTLPFWMTVLGHP